MAGNMEQSIQFTVSHCDTCIVHGQIDAAQQADVDNTVIIDAEYGIRQIKQVVGRQRQPVFVQCFLALIAFGQCCRQSQTVHAVDVDTGTGFQNLAPFIEESCSTIYIPAVFDVIQIFPYGLTKVVLYTALQLYWGLYGVSMEHLCTQFSQKPSAVSDSVTKLGGSGDS